MLSLTLLLGLGACAQYSSIKLERPAYRPASTVGAIIEKAFRHDKSEPLVALGEYVEAVRIASQALKVNPADTAARADYNFAVARIIETIGVAKLDPWTSPLRIPAPRGGEYVLTHRPDPRARYNPALYEITPADNLVIRGKYVSERMTKDGLGAPVVVVGRNRVEDAREDFVIERVYYGATAVARLDASGRCEIAFEDPLAEENTMLDGRTHSLAADYTVALALLLDRENPKKMELSRLLNPGKYAQTARLARLQPFDPNKRIVLCVHGLMDSPATWVPLINTLRADPAIRQRYQFWFFSYPSGYPYQQSAAILRGELDKASKRFPLDKKVVIVGHSMGGIISRLMITDSGGDAIWKRFFSKPPEQTPFTPQTRNLLTDALIFNHRPEIRRAIFISAPHRGADMAGGWLGRMATKLIKSPQTLLKMGEEALSVIMPESSSSVVTRIPNSVDTLSPNNRFVRYINEVPITPGIPYHSIIGDQGKGGNKDKTKPVSSDGVVPYWSSHMPGAQSELIVPFNHGAHQHAESIQEVRRILLLP